ncbi:MAG: hypothetical protein H0V81_15890 [Solirubrobacterales bacterium]|nr:hypothetical protein [Solirubrobacterales bacterium]
MLRSGVLTGRTIALAGADPALVAVLESLGARTATVNVGSPSHLSEPQTALGRDGPPRSLVADARPAFEAAGGGYDGVRAALDGAFAAARETAVACWIPTGEAGSTADASADGGTRTATGAGEIERGGQIVFIAPAPGAGRHAGAARSGLENLARTLSTEWARHGITTVAILPGDTTGEAALADLVAWLCSPAGAYLSGTALTLDRVLQPVESS